jgi:hypothetical protein
MVVDPIAGSLESQEPQYASHRMGNHVVSKIEKSTFHFKTSLSDEPSM